MTPAADKIQRIIDKREAILGQLVKLEALSEKDPRARRMSNRQRAILRRKADALQEVLRMNGVRIMRHQTTGSVSWERREPTYP